MAALPFSPVRIRMHSSNGVTKILPSPIFPERADAMIASMVGLTKASLNLPDG
jgi:hypothetical protein